MVPELILDQPRDIIPYLSLGFTLYFLYGDVGWCKFVDHSLVDEETSAFVKQSMDDKPYWFNIAKNLGVGTYYYKIFVSIPKSLRSLG